VAIYPCDIGPHRFPQPQQSIYWTLVSGDLVQTYKQRLCPSHFRTQASECQSSMAMIDDDSVVSRSCELCDNAREGALYAKVFPLKAEPQQFALDLCAGHLDELGDKLQIRAGSRMREP
jgi:hypothetical protein